MSNPSPYGPNPYGDRSNSPQYGTPQYGPYGAPRPQYQRPNPPRQPYMPQMQPNLPYGQPPRKPRKTIGGGGTAAIVISALLVPILLVVLLFGGGLIFYSKKIDEATADGGSRIDDNKPKAGSIDVWYNISERPDYQTTIDYIHKLAKDAKQAVTKDERGFLKDNNLPDNATNRKYVETYVNILATYDGYQKKDNELNSIDTKELDDMITYRKTEVDQIVEQFSKHERLGAKVVATDEDGGKRDIYTDNRTNMRRTWPELEQQVAQYQYNGDDWTSAAKEAVKLANMEIDWNIYDANAVCAPADYTHVQAAYCPMTPNLIYANSEQPNWDTAYALATVKHEIAHHAIHMRCGTIHPPVAMSDNRDRSEAVTHSYAILFLGADAEQLNRTSGSQYRYDAETDDMATKIHNNQCMV